LPQLQNLHGRLSRLYVRQRRVISNVQANAKPSYFVPQSVLFWKRLIQKSAFRHPMKVATIRLQRNRKAKMMQPDFSKTLSITQFGWGSGFRRRQRDLFK